MSAQYRFFLREADGTALAWIPPEAWLYFSYTRRVNDVGRFEGTISLTQYPQLEQYFDAEPGGYLDAILEVWRSLDDTPPIFRLEQQFLMRYRREEYTNDGRLRMTVIGRTPEFLLDSCVVFPDNVDPPTIPPASEDAAGFYADFPWSLPGSPTFTGVNLVTADGDTAEKMWALVDWCQNSETTALDNIVLPATPSGGIPEHHIAERYSNLLKALQNASAASWFASYYGLASTPASNGCDFRLNPDASAPYIPWDFEVRVGGFGTDHRASSSDPVIFSPEKNNVLQPVRITDRLEERNRIIVGGNGNDATRDVLVVVNNARIADSPTNTREEYTDSRQIDAFADPPPPAGIDQAAAYGQARLKEKGIRRQNTFIAVQQKGSRYQEDYDLGDLVTSSFNGSSEDFQIRQVEIIYSNSSGETVVLEFGGLDGTYFKGNDAYEQIVSLIKSIQVQVTEDAAAT